MKMDYERRRLWGKIIVSMAFLIMLISVPIAAARQTTHEWRCTAILDGRCTLSEWVPVDGPSPIAPAGLIVTSFGLILGVAGFTAYIYYDLKVKTGPHPEY